MPSTFRRGQRAPSKPSRKAVQAHIAAQAPPDWSAPERQKARRKLTDDDVPDMVPRDDKT